MNDWRAYDTVAEAYERVAAARFATVARHLLALARPPEGAQVLDLAPEPAQSASPWPIA
jgi:hypothetical protein